MVYYSSAIASSAGLCNNPAPPWSLSACRGRKCKPIFVQIARQVVKLNASDLRLPSRAWKVKLVGEGADDAGGVFDDTITEMCQVRPALGSASGPSTLLGTCSKCLTVTAGGGSLKAALQTPHFVPRFSCI